MPGDTRESWCCPRQGTSPSGPLRQLGHSPTASAAQSQGRRGQLLPGTLGGDHLPLSAVVQGLREAVWAGAPLRRRVFQV